MPLHLVVTDDEEPNRVDLAKLRLLKPVFKIDGVLTAGNSSSCNDGASALTMAVEHRRLAHGVVYHTDRGFQYAATT